MDECLEDRFVFRIAIDQSFRVELNAEKKREQIFSGLQLKHFYHPVTTDSCHLQAGSNLCYCLMVRAVHADLLLSGYLGQ